MSAPDELSELFARWEDEFDLPEGVDEALEEGDPEVIESFRGYVAAHFAVHANRVLMYLRVYGDVLAGDDPVLRERLRKTEWQPL